MDTLPPGPPPIGVRNSSYMMPPASIMDAEISMGEPRMYIDPPLTISGFPLTAAEMLEPKIETLPKAGKSPVNPSIAASPADAKAPIWILPLGAERKASRICTWPPTRDNVWPSGTDKKAPDASMEAGGPKKPNATGAAEVRTAVSGVSIENCAPSEKRIELAVLAWKLPPTSRAAVGPKTQPAGLKRKRFADPKPSTPVVLIVPKICDGSPPVIRPNMLDVGNDRSFWNFATSTSLRRLKEPKL